MNVFVNKKFYLRKMKKYHVILFVLSLLLFSCQEKVQVDGELKKWHKITLSFKGPKVSENDDSNPFLNYRMDVAFSNGKETFLVPGYFAADGEAHITSASEGNIWRVHFSPNKVGEWSYKVSFKKGINVAVSDNSHGFESAGYFDGTEGVFYVDETDKDGADMRAKGRLQYVGEHYLKEAETGKWFIKVGADAPENLLAFDDFDNTPNALGLRKNWSAHAQDFSRDALHCLWGENADKGKNLLGAINYLSGKKMNAFSFLTFNVDGDDRNVFPHLLKVDLQTYEDSASQKKTYKRAWKELVHHTRFDVSKMAQWEQVFEYGTQKGMFLHFKTQETENDHRMDGGDCGVERKVYYRELIARFAHHPALNWNMGEENTQKTQQVKEAVDYVHSIDPYHHLIVLHTFPEQEERYTPHLGPESNLTGTSNQLKDTKFRDVHSRVVRWVKASAKAGKKWVVAVDEPGDAGHALMPDAEDELRIEARGNALWGTLMGGGCGVEWYFGYKHPHSDLTCQDWRSRDEMWEQSYYAAEFLRSLPVDKMFSKDELVAEGDYCFCQEGILYVVYFKYGTKQGHIDLSGQEGSFKGQWYNPRKGIYIDEEVKVVAGQKLTLDKPNNEDWVLKLMKH